MSRQRPAWCAHHAGQLDHLPNAWFNQALLHAPTDQPRDSFTRWVAPVESQVLDKLNRAQGQQEHQYNTQQTALVQFPIPMGAPRSEPGPTAALAAHVVTDRVHNGKQTMNNPPSLPFYGLPASGADHSSALSYLHDSGTLADCTRSVEVGHLLNDLSRGLARPGMMASDEAGTVMCSC